MLQTVEKVGSVLDLFTVARPRWTLSGVAGEVGMPRSSVHGLLSALVDVGLLQSAGRGVYTLGWRPFELGTVHLRSLDVCGAGRRVVEALAGDTGESAYLTVLDRGRLVEVVRQRGTNTVSVSLPPAAMGLAAHAGAAGKVLLAHRRPVEVDTVLAGRRQPRSSVAPPAARETLARELDDVRARGVGVDRGGVVDEVWCVAAPVRDELGLVVAAVGVSLPRFRWRLLPDLERAVLAAACALSPLPCRAACRTGGAAPAGALLSG